MALEESQSLLMEMVLARSRPFAQYLQPLLEKHYGMNGVEWQAENIYRQLTLVRRGVLRLEADELTYPAHLLMRYELEKKLLSGELAVVDLPAAWAEAAESRLGIAPQSHVEGCLQDLDWAVGRFGYFPASLLGDLISMQLWEKLHASREDLDAEIARGDFVGLVGWLADNVHALGAKMTVQDLVQDATGRALSAAPALRYLEAKYLEPR